MTTDTFFAKMALPPPVAEFEFHASRKWRFDYAWPEHMLALEVEGGIWSGGRHTSPQGFLKDMEKYNAAAAMGWRILRTTPKHLLSLGNAVLIRDALKVRNLESDLAKAFQTIEAAIEAEDKDYHRGVRDSFMHFLGEHDKTIEAARGTRPVFDKMPNAKWAGKAPTIRT